MATGRNTLWAKNGLMAVPSSALKEGQTSSASIRRAAGGLGEIIKATVACSLESDCEDKVCHAGGSLHRRVGHIAFKNIRHALGAGGLMGKHGRRALVSGRPISRAHTEMPSHRLRAEDSSRR